MKILLRSVFLITLSFSLFSCEVQLLENASNQLVGAWYFDWVKDCGRVTCNEISDQYAEDRINFFDDNTVEWSYDGKIASGSWELQYIDGDDDSEMILVMSFGHIGSTDSEIRIWEDFRVNNSRLRGNEDINSGEFRYRMLRD